MHFAPALLQLEYKQYGQALAPTLRASKAPLLAIFGSLDTPEGVKANVRAIRQILDQRRAAITPLRFTQTDGTT